MSVSARPRATTTAPITNTPSAQARYLIMTNRKKMAATQVSAVTNSYMLPQGARCTASPLVTTATTCASTPTVLSAMAACTQGPAWPIARSGGSATSGIESGMAAGLPAAAASARPSGTSGPDSPAGPAGPGSTATLSGGASPAAATPAAPTAARAP